MKRKKIYELRLQCCGIVSVALMLCCCSQDSTDAADEATEISPTTGVAFIVDDGGDVSTRVTYSGVSTTFENGDAVGCVVCTKSSTTDENTGETTESYVFKANSKWQYNSNNSCLYPVKIWKTSTDDSGNTTLDSDGTDITQGESGLLGYDSSYKMTTTSADKLYFFFYHPLMTSTDIYSSWTSYPVYIAADQSDNLAASDLMWAKGSKGINALSSGDVTLTFAKKTATVLLTSNLALKDVKMSPATSSSITTGNYFNLQTGAYVTTNNPDNNTITSSTDTAYITPYSSSDRLTHYFLLPPQSSFDAELSFLYEADGSNVTQSQSLSTFSTLNAGTLYKVSTSATYSADSIYFKSSGAEYSSGFSNVSLGQSVTNGTKYGTCTVNGQSYTYWEKMNSSGSLQFTLSDSRTVTLYLGTLGLTVNSGATVVVTNTEDNSTSYSYTKDSSEYSAGNDGTSASVTFTLSAGTWKITRNSAEWGLFFVMATHFGS